MEKFKLFGCSKRIGLIADSHGNLNSIEQGVITLRGLRTDVMIHLGDIYDSLENDDIFKIYQIISKNNFFTVKGNNDFQVENLLTNGHSFDVSLIQKKRILSFLKQMPMRLVDEKICFTHSLPFNSIRSFYEPIDTGTTDRASQLFSQTPYSIIFCGHSHSSIIFRMRKGVVTREQVNPGEVIGFHSSERYIVIVGSSDNGECGLFDKKQMSYQKILIHQ